MYATPWSSLGTVTLKAELAFGGPAPVPAPGEGGGLPVVCGSSSAFVTSNMPVCEYLEPAEMQVNPITLKTIVYYRRTII